MTPTPEPPNVHRPRFDAASDRGAFRWQRAFLGRQAGADQLGASLLDVAPGASTFPYHAHHANEELLVVLAGQPTLRTPAGERRLADGEVVSFPAGAAGAHALRNDTGEVVRVLVVSTMLAPEINEFPDSGVLWARSFVPGRAPGEGDVVAVGRIGDELDVLAGEV
jgi:uncharacterized cupin superfamily protein